MGKVISVITQKGGVGKTTLACNIGVSLTLEGKSVLFVDLDGQCSLTMSLGYDPLNFDDSVVSALTSPAKVGQCIFETDLERVSLLPASPMLSSIEESMYSKKDKHDRLKRVLEKVKPLFDFIVIDTNPTLNIFSMNALVAADYLLVPAETKYQSDFSLDTFFSTFETLKAVKNPELTLLGLVATMYNCQANEDREVLEGLQVKGNVLGIIKRTAAASKSVKDGVPAVVGQKKTVVAKEFRRITTEILKIMEG